MNYKHWLRSRRINPWWPYQSKRVMLRRVGRWIRWFEKKHGIRSRFRDVEVARQF